MAAPKKAKTTKSTPAKAKPKAAASKTKTARERAKSAGKPSAVVADKALKARWEEALRRYVRARTEETEGWDARYEALGDILDSDPPLYLAGGYTSAAAF